MRVAFLSLPVPGHLNPKTALARKYHARGQEVVFLSLLDVAPFVQAAQLPFVPLRRIYILKVRPGSIYHN